MLTAIAVSVAASAQTSDFQRRYNLMLDRVGPSGVGMETLIENWSKAEPDSPDMMQARFYFYLSKAQGTEVVVRSEPKYLGMDPILSLKDSTDADVYYYEVIKYEDEMFAESLKAVDRLISAYPDRLDFRFIKANAYISYERECPDMALANILGLAYEYKTSKDRWFYKEPGTSEPTEVDDEMFAGMMQEYCYSLYTLGTSSSYDAFLKLSMKLNEYFPKNPDFLANIGSYHMVVNKDCKTALKYYDKALKLQSDNASVLHNALLASRKLQNKKLEKKYLKMLGN